MLVHCCIDRDSILVFFVVGFIVQNMNPTIQNLLWKQKNQWFEESIDKSVRRVTAWHQGTPPYR